jgi:hypothetical protein
MLIVLFNYFAQGFCYSVNVPTIQSMYSPDPGNVFQVIDPINMKHQASSSQ